MIRRPVVDFYHLFDEDELFGFAKPTPIIVERVEFLLQLASLGLFTTQLGSLSEFGAQLGSLSIFDTQISGRSQHNLQLGGPAEFEVQQ